MIKKKIKYIFSLVFAIAIISTYSSTSSADDLDLVAESAILIDAETGQILYEKNAFKEMYPASTTKIMTLILGLEYSNLYDQVTVDEDTPYQVIGSHIALEPGEMLAMEHILDAIAISSANDAAMVLAKHISGSIDEFSKLMNEKAVEIGALNTHFVNPSGLPDKSHKTTAYDLALMGKYGLKNSNFRDLVTKSHSIIPTTNKKDEERYLSASNRMLFSTQTICVDGEYVPIKYDGVTGIKTGFTNDAQHCLVASAKRDGREYISVVLKSERTVMYADTHKLLNYAFENFEKTFILSEDIHIDSVDIDGKSLKVGVENDLYLNSKVGTSSEFSSDILLFEDLKRPIERGSTVGTVNYIVDGAVVGSDKLVAMSSISSLVALDFLLEYNKTILLGLLTIVSVLFILRVMHVQSRRKRKKLSKNKNLRRQSLRG